MFFQPEHRMTTSLRCRTSHSVSAEMLTNAPIAMLLALSAILSALVPLVVQ